MMNANIDTAKIISLNKKILECKMAISEELAKYDDSIEVISTLIKVDLCCRIDYELQKETIALYEKEELANVVLAFLGKIRPDSLNFSVSGSDEFTIENIPEADMIKILKIAGKNLLNEIKVKEEEKEYENNIIN